MLINHLHYSCIHNPTHSNLHHAALRLLNNKNSTNGRSQHTFFGFWIGTRTARMASSNTVFRPFCVKAEHSKYFTAFTSFAIWSPCWYVIGWSFFSLSLLIVSGSSRRSSLVPTKIIGVFGQWCVTSGNHYTAWPHMGYNSSSYLVSDVLIWWRANKWEANQKYISLWVGEWTESIIVLLTWIWRRFWLNTTPSHIYREFMNSANAHKYKLSL